MNVREAEKHSSFLGRAFSSLRHRNYRLYWTGQSISLIGTWMQSVAQGWLVLQLTNSSFYLGLVSALGSLPVLLFSLFGGALADQVPKKKLLIITQTLLSLEAFALGSLVLLGIVQTWHVILLSFFMGIMNAVDMPTRQSFIVEMVGKDDLMNAIGLNSTSFNAARIVGPVIAGLLISAVGVGGCFILNGVSYFATLAALLFMHLPTERTKRIEIPVLSSIKDGLRYAWQDRTVFALLSVVAITSIFAFNYLPLMPVFARDVLSSGAFGLGGLMSAVGAGALVGAFSVTAMSSRRRKGRLVMAGNLILCLSLIAFSLSQNYWVSIFFLAWAGGAMVTQNITVNTMLQTSTPDSHRGRVMALYTTTFVGMAPFGSFLAGTLAQFLGAPLAVLIGASITIVFVTLMILNRRQILTN